MMSQWHYLAYALNNRPNGSYMVETLTSGLVSLITAIPFTSATWMVLMVLAGVVWLFAKASQSPDSPIDWVHLVTDGKTQRASPYKLGYLVGLISSTWVIITYADKSTLSADVFGIYLAFVLGGAGWNTYVKSRPGSSSTGTDQSTL